MGKKTYYNSGASLMRAQARQYKSSEDDSARVKEQVDEIIPRNYAAMGLVLARSFGFTQEMVEQVIVETQELYNESLFEGFNILQTCSDEVGIDMYGEVHAKRHRIVGDLRI